MSATFDLDADFIRKLAKLLEETGLSEIRIRRGRQKNPLRRHAWRDHATCSRSAAGRRRGGSGRRNKAGSDRQPRFFADGRHRLPVACAELAKLR